MADIAGQGAIQHVWMTPTDHWRFSILRIYWDDADVPAVECPVGDFFACGWQKYSQVSSLAVCVNPGSGLNCYWEMPFRKRFSQMRFGMYRWHIADPIRFEKDLRVTIQALGWRSGGRYLPLQDDIASVAYWYQALPTAPFPPLPGRDALEII